MYPDLREETKDKEIDFITAIAKDMLDNDKSWYTNTYEFSTGERFKIEIQKLITEPISKDML